MCATINILSGSLKSVVTIRFQQKQDVLQGVSVVMRFCTVLFYPCPFLSFTAFRRFGRGWCNVRNQTPSLGAGICFHFAVVFF